MSARYFISPYVCVYIYLYSLYYTIPYRKRCISIFSMSFILPARICVTHFHSLRYSWHKQHQHRQHKATTAATINNRHTEIAVIIRYIILVFLSPFISLYRSIVVRLFIHSFGCCFFFFFLQIVTMNQNIIISISRYLPLAVNHYAVGEQFKICNINSRSMCAVRWCSLFFKTDCAYKSPPKIQRRKKKQCEMIQNIVYNSIVG